MGLAPLLTFDGWRLILVRTSWLMVDSGWGRLIAGLNLDANRFPEGLALAVLIMDDMTCIGDVVLRGGALALD